MVEKKVCEFYNKDKRPLIELKCPVEISGLNVAKELFDKNSPYWYDVEKYFALYIALYCKSGRYAHCPYHQALDYVGITPD